MAAELVRVADAAMRSTLSLSSGPVPWTTVAFNCSISTGRFKKSFTNLKAYMNLLGRYVQYFELS
jgi:hypothetical protein